MAAPAKSYPQTIAFRSVQREAILCDPDFRGGDYALDRFPEKGLALARKIGMITYRSDLEFNQRFQRQMRDPRPHFLEGKFEVQSYLDRQGEKFVARFDPNTYLYFSRAMDLYDLERGYPSLEAALSRVQARTLLMAIDSDFLCPLAQVEEVRSALQRTGRDVNLNLIQSIHGHDAFLMEIAQIHAYLESFMRN
jgi:homoserine O-acetyltransferase